MSFIKYRNGVTGVGRQMANWIQGDALEHTNRSRGDVRVVRAGEFTNVFQNPSVGVDGYYSLGRVGGATRILGSADARTFADRGPAPVSGGFITTQLGFYGKGLGVVLVPSEIGFTEDFDGGNAFVFELQLQRTRDGRALTDYYSVFPIIPFGVTDTLYTHVRGGYRQVGSTHVFHTGMVYTTMPESGQHVPIFMYDDGQNRQVGITTYFPNQRIWFSDVSPLAPGTFIKMDRYLRPTYEDTVINVAACPGLDFTYTTDGGLTWAVAASTALFSEFDTVTDLPTDTTAALMFNEAVQFAQLLTAPLSRGLSVALAHVPYVAIEAGDPVLKMKIKLGLINTLAGCAMTGTLTLYDGSPTNAARFGSRGLLAIPGGVLVFTRPITGANNEWSLPMRVQFTPNGTDLVDHAYMPQPEYKTGVPSGISKTTMVCPMYVDGEHALFQSKDFGVTWTKRGTITDEGVPPVDAPLSGEEDYVLRDFPVLTFLRQDNAAANAFPLTPWLTDSRQPEPPPI